MVQIYQTYPNSTSLTHCILLYIFDSETPQPTVYLANFTLHSLSISWSVKSPHDGTNYIVFWWSADNTIDRSVPLNDTTFVIEDLLTNTAYHVVVQANGPLGNVNSTTKVFYTTPSKVQGRCTGNVYHFANTVWPETLAVEILFCNLASEQER